jgi:hypothetical protein
MDAFTIKIGNQIRATSGDPGSGADFEGRYFKSVRRDGFRKIVVSGSSKMNERAGSAVSESLP